MTEKTFRRVAYSAIFIACFYSPPAASVLPRPRRPCIREMPSRSASPERTRAHLPEFPGMLIKSAFSGKFPAGAHELRSVEIKNGMPACPTRQHPGSYGGCFVCHRLRSAIVKAQTTCYNAVCVSQSMAVSGGGCVTIPCLRERQLPEAVHI